MVPRALVALSLVTLSCRSTPSEPPPSSHAAPVSEAPARRDPLYSGRLAGPFPSLEGYCATRASGPGSSSQCVAVLDGGRALDRCRCDPRPATGSEAQALPPGSQPFLEARFFETLSGATEPTRWSLGLRTRAGWFVYPDLVTRQDSPLVPQFELSAALEVLTVRRARDGAPELVVRFREDRVRRAYGPEDPMGGHRTTNRLVIFCHVYEDSTPWCSNRTPAEAT